MSASAAPLSVPPAAPPAGRRRHRAEPRAAALWLFAVAGLVFLMVVVGGITRLTESGLSITRWEPVSGAVPPLSHADWEAEFARYRQTPEYKLVNRRMDLADFQRIYFWEYVHRLMGRLIGLAFAVPLAIFAWRRALPPGFAARLALLLGLGAAQGAVGWWMVASGLVERTDVAPERLAVHLALALAILGALVWTGLDLLRLDMTRGPARPPARSRGSAAWVPVLLGLFALQVVLGALTAGLEAGHAFATWPKMGEHWIPPLGLERLALVDNPVAAQFFHRSLALAVAGAALLVAWRLATRGAGWRAAALAGAVLLQFTLGVLTILEGVPLVLGVMHQAGAALLLVTIICAAHWAVRGPEPAPRPVATR